MKDFDDANWEKRHPVLSGIINGCYVLICLFFAMIVVYLTVYVLITMKDERVLLEVLAERMGI